jgi:hypothetical protein
MGGMGRARRGAVLLLSGVLLSSLTMPARSQDECSIYGLYNDEVREALSEGFEFPNYAQLCAWLSTNGLGVDISAASGVAHDRFYGWAVVRLVRRSDNLIARAYSSSTAMAPVGDQATQRGALLAAINDAMSSLARQRDEHFADFQIYQRQIRPQ